MVLVSGWKTVRRKFLWKPNEKEEATNNPPPISFPGSRWFLQTPLPARRCGLGEINHHGSRLSQGGLDFEGFV